MVFIPGNQCFGKGVLCRFHHERVKDNGLPKSKKINIAFSFAPFKEKPYFCVPFESKGERNRINE
jgi:hypothetical protein